MLNHAAQQGQPVPAYAESLYPASLSIVQVGRESAQSCFVNDICAATVLSVLEKYP